MVTVIRELTYVAEYRVWIAFDNGHAGEVDLRDELYGEAYESLLALDIFRAVRLDPTLNLACWPNGLDMLGEFLYRKLIGL